QQLHACCACPSASAANQLSDGKNKAQLLISTAFLYFKDGILMNHLKALQKVAVLALVFAGYTNSADAAIVYPFSAVSSSSYPGYEAQYAIDQGGSSAVTDWASGSQGAGSFINFDLGSTFSLAQAFVTDRVTSGGGN